MNDICNASELLVSIIYVNDTFYLQISGNDIAYLVSSLNVELELLSRWLKAYQVSLNAQKTFHLFFDGSTLNWSTNIKYIGVIMDRKLKWCEHIAHVKNKVSNRIGIYYKARQFRDKKGLHNPCYYYIII